MAWDVIFHADFDREFDDLPVTVQDELVANLGVLKEKGPSLGRPHADTLAGSKYANMKELRFRANNGVWRAAFAFDPTRKAVVLVAGDKIGISQSRFYKSLISKADDRYSAYLKHLEEQAHGQNT
jgi:hypothetical protein